VSDTPLHVVLGVGQVGRAVTRRLAESGAAVRAVSRRQPTGLPEGVDWWHADLTDDESAIDATKGAAVVYQCLNVPYTRWPELFPPLQTTVLAAAERADAVLVTLENTYAYGPVGRRPMTEALPLAAASVKGRTRAAMTTELLEAAEAGQVRMTIGRASDFFGAEVTESVLGSWMFGNALAGKRADFIGDPELPHTYSYVPDVARGLVTLGSDERALGQVWHLPGPETVSTRAILDLCTDEIGHRVGIRALPPVVARALGLVNPMMRGLAEMSYQFQKPFILDTSKYAAVFGTATTPLARAVHETICWYRTRGSAS
jgi:nucleoside-diphosphate-sugar epimerase